jgi:hypothetical protein
MSAADNNKEAEEEEKAAEVGEAPASDGAAPATTPDRQVQVQQGLPLDWTHVNHQPRPLPVRYPADVAEISPEETELVIVGTAGQKITRIGPDFSETVNPATAQLVLRSHMIRTMEGLERFERLELLELYDNQVDELACLADGEGGAPGRTLRVLDMSYNVIRDMAPVQLCPNLQELCT